MPRSAHRELRAPRDRDRRLAEPTQLRARPNQLDVHNRKSARQNGPRLSEAGMRVRMTSKSQNLCDEVLALLWHIYSRRLRRVRLQWGHRYGIARARMASTARRIAGRVGFGGPWRILFSPARLGEAAALQVGVGDHRHQ